MQPKSGSDSIGTNQLNPIESPDAVLKSTKAHMQKPAFFD